MQLEIPREIETTIHANAAAAGYQSVEDYILDKLELDVPSPGPTQMPHDQWLRKFESFLARQVSRNPNFDDSRESIYPVR
jgi:hypothetical protein